MEESPKSLWLERSDPIDPSLQWVTHYDDMPWLQREAEIINICQRGGLPLPIADDMELWEIAAALGMHRIETLEERDNREIVQTKQEYFEETGSQRLERVSGYRERRRQRDLERRQERARTREERVDA